MAKAKNGSAFLEALGSVRLYKRNQGKLTRQLTAAALVVVVGVGAWTLSQGVLSGSQTPLRVGLPTLIAAVGCWVIFRGVNYPRFADFLISVEAEMDKVTWSSRSELYRATVVVLVSMFSLGAVLFLFDMFWQMFFEAIGFLQISS